jgi:hypothetical protein
MGGREKRGKKWKNNRNYTQSMIMTRINHGVNDSDHYGYVVYVMGTNGRLNGNSTYRKKKSGIHTINK